MRRLRATETSTTILFLSVLVACVLLLCSPLTAQDSASPTPTVNEAIHFAVSPPLSEIAKMPRAPQYGFHEAPPVRRIPKRDFGVAVDPVEQSLTFGPPAVNYTIGLDFLGVGNGFPGYTVPDAPPDTNMAVGDTQIIQWVNVSFAIFNKFNPSNFAGPILGGDLWEPLGGPCVGNNAATSSRSGTMPHTDGCWPRTCFRLPVLCVRRRVDRSQRTRFLLPVPIPRPGQRLPRLSQVGPLDQYLGPDHEQLRPLRRRFCRARSLLVRTEQAAGRKRGQTGVFPALAARFDSLLPADIDSPTSPPSTECQFFIGSVGVTSSTLSLYSACIDWLHPSLAYMTGNHNSQLTTVATYSVPCGGGFGGACVPQKGPQRPARLPWRSPDVSLRLLQRSARRGRKR